MKIEKYINENEQVAVLVSRGYGAGWSTWNSPENFLAMDKGLVELKITGAVESQVEAYCKDKTGESPYMGGWADVEIEWLDQGESFEIDEYDGSESIKTVLSLSHTA